MKTTLSTLKNLYAQEHAYKDWNELQELHKYNPREIESYMNEICIRAQKAALEKAAENARINGSEFSRCGCEIDRNSITNPENLIR